MIGCKDVSLGANDYTEPRPLQRLFPLSSRSSISEKLPQPTIRKRKRRLSARDSLCGKHCHDTRRDLFHNRSERRDNSLARLLWLLRYRRDQVRLHIEPCEDEECARSHSSRLHNTLTAKENRTHNLYRLFFDLVSRCNLGLTARRNKALIAPSKWNATVARLCETRRWHLRIVPGVRFAERSGYSHYGRTLASGGAVRYRGRSLPAKCAPATTLSRGAVRTTPRRLNLLVGSGS